MKVKTIFTPLIFGVLSSVIFNAQSATIFEDSFETGDMSATNSEGFKWTDHAWTSIVSRTEEVYGVTNTPRTKANAAAFPGGDWTPHSGKYSMRFRYSAGKPMSEQRFDLGTPHKELWISYWIRVPINFKYGPVGDPNKFLSIWMDGYSQAGDGSTVWLSMWRKNSTDVQLGFTYSLGGYTSSISFKQYTPFITTADAGRWMRIIFHVKSESSPGASDGIIQTYRRWKGQTGFTKLHEMKNVPLKVDGVGINGFKAGYILGWANAAYKVDTEWLMDDFMLSDTPPSELLGEFPKPPTNLSTE